MSKFIDCTTWCTVVNCGLWLVIVYQYWLISSNKCTTRMKEINNSRHWWQVVEGMYGKSLTLLNFCVNLKITKNSVLIFLKEALISFFLFGGVFFKAFAHSSFCQLINVTQFWGYIGHTSIPLASFSFDICSTQLWIYRNVCIYIFIIIWIMNYNIYVFTIIVLKSYLHFI